jgi:glycosyltransferase involved in cell wall biosynthesis
MSNKPLRILIISSDWRNIFQTAFEELWKKLERDVLRPGFNQFFFFSWSEVSYFEKKDEQFSTLHKKTRWRFFRPFTDFLSLFYVPIALRKYGFTPDVVLVYDFGFIPVANVLRWIYGSKRVLCLTNMPQIYSETRRWGKIKALYSFVIERAFVRFVDVAYTINRTMRDYVIKVGADPKKVVVFASNTINRDMTHIKSSKKGEIRKKYHLHDKKIILSIGRLEAEKGFPRLFELFKKLPNDFVLLVLGQGSLKADFEKQVEKIGIKDRVIFEGWVGRDGIWNYYQDADIFVLLSNAEALGLVFWEAMYMGVPVIGSEAEGIVESVGNDGERGFIHRKGDSDEMFIEKVEKSISVSPERATMLENARRFVESEISNPVSINDVV